MQLRNYQIAGIKKIEAAIASGKRRVLSVAPTGAGKGAMACALLARYAAAGKRVMFAVHRREIALKVHDEELSGFTDVEPGAILPGRRRRLASLIQVASTQSLLAGKAWPSVDLLILDEAHHYVADEWKRLAEMFPDAVIVGFTATPQRSDGRPLREVFDELIVVATYSELLKAGHIVPCRVLRPDRNLGMDLAQHPVTAYERYCNGKAALVYVLRVEDAELLGAEFSEAGHVTAVVSEKTPKAERDDIMARYRDGSITVLVNVYTLTEGVDLPRAEAIILARRCESEMTYLQICGRGLRTYQQKPHCTLIDLVGAYWSHGLPTEDRHYSLDGRAKQEREAKAPEHAPPREPNVLGVDLYTEDGEPVRGSSGPDPKREYWQRLMADIESDKMTVDGAQVMYRKRFGENSPWAARVPRRFALRDARNAAMEYATDSALMDL